MAKSAPAVHHQTPSPAPTPTPVYNMQIGATPLPVVVKSEPDPIWTYWVPGIGILISALAALFAGLALKRIGDQIVIARQQIGLANDQIDLANEQIDIANLQSQIANDSLKATRDSIELAQKDFDLTAQSLAINQEQAQKEDAERAKRPQLIFSINNHMVRMNIKAGNFVFVLYIGNAGQLLSEGAAVTVLWPSKGIVDRLDTLDPIARVGAELTAMKDNTRLWPGKVMMAEGQPIYYFYQQLEKKILPLTTLYYAHLDASVEPGEYVVRWNIVASDGMKFPTDKPWGEIAITAEAE